MNVESVFRVGFKVLAAVVVGAAVIAGIDKAVGGSKQADNLGNPGKPAKGGDGNLTANSGANFNTPRQTCDAPRTKTDMILSGIRGAGDTCGKLFNVAQSLSQLIESAGSIFGGGPRPQGFVPAGTYGTQHSFRSGNITWVPVSGSSCILQAVPTTD